MRTQPLPPGGDEYDCIDCEGSPPPLAVGVCEYCDNCLCRKHLKKHQKTCDDPTDRKEKS